LYKGAIILEKGLFGIYKQKIYEVSRINTKQVRLVSRHKEDLEQGFTERIYLDNYLKQEGLPRLYIKVVERANLYEIDYKIKHAADIFDFISERQNRKPLIGNDDAKLAKKHNFSRIDKYYSEKEVNKRDIEIIKEKKLLEE